MLCIFNNPVTTQFTIKRTVVKELHAFYFLLLYGLQQFSIEVNHNNYREASF